MSKKYLIVVVGPTAIGKSALAIQLALYYHTQIISADSRQVYKEMQIGTAVPSEAELAAVPHHFIRCKSIFEPWSTGHFERDAIARINSLFKKHDILIMAGGSGLYIDAVLNGLDTFPDIAPEIRAQLNIKLHEEGIAALQQQLQETDPEYFKEVDIHNPRRLIRALEVFMATQKPYSSFLKQKPVKRNFTPLFTGLTADRETVYRRINERVDHMMAQGLLEEAQQLYPNKDLNALQTVGYKELFEYLDGKCSLEEAVSEIKKNTRRYAKRQLTWFGRNKNIRWFYHPVDPGMVVQSIQDDINKKQ